MLKSLNKLTLRAIVEFLVLLLIFSFIGVLIYAKVDDAITKSLEESVKQQAQTLAFGIEQPLKQEFDKLQTSSNLVEEGRVYVDDLVRISLIGTEGQKMGIIARSGEVIAGTSLTDEALKLLYSAFNGHEVLKYRQNIGLIFAVPIKIDNEACILYEIFDDDAIRRKFMALSYNGAGTLYIHNGMDNWVILSKGWYFFSPSYMMEGWHKLGDKCKENGNTPNAKV